MFWLCCFDLTSWIFSNFVWHSVLTQNQFKNFLTYCYFLVLIQPATHHFSTIEHFDLVSSFSYDSTLSTSTDPWGSQQSSSAHSQLLQFLHCSCAVDLFCLGHLLLLILDYSSILLECQFVSIICFRHHRLFSQTYFSSKRPNLILLFV